MNRLNRFLKVFLVLVMLSLQLWTPLVIDAENITEDQSYEDFEDFYDDDFGMEDDSASDLESVEFFNAVNDEGLPAITGYVPEMLFIDDVLLDIEEDEIFLPIEPRNIPAVGSGLVQFVLEPVNWNTDWGTLAQARAAAFNARTVYHPLFATATAGATNTATAVNGRYGRDALFLGQSANGNRFRVLIAGFEGYVNRVGHQRNITVPVNGVNRTFAVTANAVFVPFSNYPNNTGSTSVRSVSHYVNRNGELFRYLTNNVTGTGGFTRFLTGPAPSWMTQNTRYYSFDGVYFYRNPRNIRVNGSGAVNANNPFFNYFQYLSFRSASTITAAQIDTFIANPNNNNSWHTINTANGVMRGLGSDFVHAQNRYGVNAILMVAKGMHESAGGTSYIARTRNNLFGLGAIDGDPVGGARVYARPADSINDLADRFLSRGYLWHGDWRNEGPHPGHKGSGMNVRYATDPYWGQKIAGWAFRIDRSRPANSRDLNREQIAIRQNTSSVAVTNAGGTTLYTANPRQARYFPFLVSGTSGNRLRIVTDSAIVNGVPNRTALFNRNNAVGYIPNTNIWLTGAGSPATNPPNNNNNDIVPPAIQVSPQVAATTANVNFRRGPSTNHSIIRLLANGTSVTILGTNADGSWSYIREGNQYGWISTEFVNVPATPPVMISGLAIINARGIPLRNGAGTSFAQINSLARNTNVVILGESANGNWTQVRVGNQTGWVNSSRLTRVTVNGQINARNIPLRSGAGTSFAQISSLAIYTEVVILGESANGNWAQVRAGNQTGWINNNRIRRVLPYGQINARDIPLRDGPGTQFSSIRSLSRNTNVVILAQTTNGNWTQVRVGSQTGWVNSNRINQTANGRINARGIPLRNGPGTSYSSISSLAINTNVIILAQTTNGNWAQVRVGNQTGWVNSNRIN